MALWTNLDENEMNVRRSFVGKLGSVASGALRHPDLVRNRLFGSLNYWPVSRLRNQWTREIPYFCINMASDVRRRRLAQRQANKLGLERFRFVDAVVGTDLDIQQLVGNGIYDDEAAQRYHGRSLAPSEIALSLSHAGIYQTMLDEDLNQAIILEDDVLFLPRNLDALDLSNLPEDYDVLFLHAHIDEVPPRGLIRGNIYKDVSYLASTVAYMVSRQGAGKLAKGARPVRHASDGLLGRAMKRDADAPHDFRQQGVDFEISSYLLYPHAALNGSTCHFIGSSISG
jgi:glycosyl transferase family 25